MYAEIHARSGIKENSPGKTTWVNDSAPEFKLGPMPAAHLGCPPWCIEIKASTDDIVNDGEYGGKPRVVLRSLKVHLGPQDLCKLVEFAIANGLMFVGAASEVKVKDSGK